MSDVEFSEEKAYNASLERAIQSAPKKGLGSLPIKLGLAKDETGANIVLGGVGILAIVIGIIVFVSAA